MGVFSADNPWVFIFGLLGNISSFAVFIAPYAMLWIYYAFTKSGAFLLITINSFGCVVETIYIAIYIAYAPKQYRRQVIITKSVEFMPFHLSFMLTFSAIAWLLYGIFLKDLHIAIPNVLGLVFGILQMVLYAIYRKYKTVVIEELKVPQHTIDVTKPGAVVDSDVEEISSSERRIDDNHHHHHETIAKSWEMVLNTLTLFVDNLSSKLHWKGLWQIFGRQGGVSSVYIASKRSVKGSRFAFVRTGSKEDASRMWLNGIMINESRISVSIARGKHLGYNKHPRVKKWMPKVVEQVSVERKCLDNQIKVSPVQKKIIGMSRIVMSKN
ncbi:hypothetical protein F3Y22_tig00109908pilonHSYRG00027 [Hibiscus syriacus]|uniref:Bidirectional sugar transporter SWEET n=1 Tax=Hibiscus syriacus TaxID=106335 RepID=A0A6A3BTY7_HIBSY|nr:hypothetical protein F3Y22_tig00109908pilonHSYRG00027 [Hibiscus syriacus]